MRTSFYIIAISLLLIVINFGQLTVQDQESTPNTLMQVNDEGSSGSITLPSLSSIGSSASKLYNLSGSLYWDGSELNTVGSSLWSQNANHIYYNLGHVGIGTSNPGAELHIKGFDEINRIKSTTLDGWISIYNSNGYMGYLGTFSGDNDIDIGTGSGNPTGKLHLVTKAIPQMTIENEGQVGIQTTTPNASLDVNGDVILGQNGSRFLEIRELIGTTGSSGNFLYNTNFLPIGWIGSNTRLLSLEIFNGNVWVTMGYSYGTDHISAYLTSGNRDVQINYPDLSMFHSKLFRVVVMRMP